LNELEGNLLDGVFATCCVPIMFAPAMVNGRPYFDGGLFDDAGLMGLTGVPESNLIINVICDQSVLPSSVPPIRFPGCRVRRFYTSIFL
jgi:predicted acylesterase/phospholipase RssA